VRTTLTLCCIGLAAGFLSALFGVGGGIVIVPALVGLMAYDVRVATATSLAAIGLTSVFGAVRYGISGDVQWWDAVLVGVPAIAGAWCGTTLQRRVGGRELQLGFAGLLVVIGVKLVVA
jgi:uncharacterized protein